MASPPGTADAVERAAELLDALCTKAGIDASHGIQHARAVLGHADKALAASPSPLPEARALAVRLSALLHDADDKKYFPSTAASLANAVEIMRSVGASDGVVEDATRMIRLVSCSANGNSVPADAVASPEILWPRWADRLEATGEIGVVRCYMYNKPGVPLFTDATPRPATDDEALALATPERFAEYQRSGGSSASMLDHYYDKLLQVARPPASDVRNEYLEMAARERARPLLDVCLAFGRTGAVDVDAIKAMAKKLNLDL